MEFDSFILVHRLDFVVLFHGDIPNGTCFIPEARSLWICSIIFFLLLITCHWSVWQDFIPLKAHLYLLRSLISSWSSSLTMFFLYIVIKGFVYMYCRTYLVIQFLNCIKISKITMHSSIFFFLKLAWSKANEMKNSTSLKRFDLVESRLSSRGNK
jgi:hypothetical protein